MDPASLEGFNQDAQYPVEPPPGPRGRASSGTSGGGSACDSARCPLGSLPDPLGHCVSSVVGAGDLCIAAAAAEGGGSAAGPACGDFVTPREHGPPAEGGAVLRLLAAGEAAGAARGGACSSAVRGLATGLVGRVMWAGFRYAYHSTPVDSGVFWEVLGDPGAALGSVLGKPRACTNSRAGPAAEQTELTVIGQPLGTRAAVFGLLLRDPAAPKGQPPGGFGAVLVPGAAPGTLEATLFSDASVGACGLSSVGARPAGGSCKLVMKVEAGSFLGVSAPSPAACPRGTIQGNGGRSCLACPPGYAAVKGACKECGGGSYSPGGLWGAEACKTCSTPAWGPGARLSC